MALTKFEVDVANVSKLDNEPNDVSGMSAEELKAVFDKAGVDIKAFLNGGLLVELERLGVEQLVQYGSGDAKYIRVNADKVLEVSADGVAWTATGSSGHLVLDKNGVELPQRSRMQFVNSEVKDEDGVTRVYGIKGDTGQQGERGEKGETGSVGPVGKTGPSIVPSVDANGVMSFSVQDTAIAPPSVNVRGPQGPQGVQGLQGLTGATGPQGIQGVAGPQGIQGTQGPAGPAGPTGGQGPVGPQGPRGEDGADGKSFVIQDIYPTLGALKSAFPNGNEYAYQVTAENDEIFIWSELANDWASLGALQGPAGPAGPQGVQGPQGATGPQGIQGIQGPQGIQGETGPQGATGAQGVQGVAGKDAYVGAQENGYAGSESQFYSDLAKITTTVTVATNAQSAANTAQTAANEAKSAAATAQNTADAAQTAAGNAASAAQTAQNTANSAASAAATANTNAANALNATKISDTTAAALGLTGDPTVDDALQKLQNNVENVNNVGDVKSTLRTDLGDKWALCNGELVYADGSVDEELLDVLPSSATEPRKVIPDSIYNANTITETINGYWCFNYVDSKRCVMWNPKTGVLKDISVAPNGSTSYITVGITWDGTRWVMAQLCNTTKSIIFQTSVNLENWTIVKTISSVCGSNQTLRMAHANNGKRCRFLWDGVAYRLVFGYADNSSGYEFKYLRTYDTAFNLLGERGLGGWADIYAADGLFSLSNDNVLYAFEPGGTIELFSASVGNSTNGHYIVLAKYAEGKYLTVPMGTNVGTWSNVYFYDKNTGTRTRVNNGTIDNSYTYALYSPVFYNKETSELVFQMYNSQYGYYAVRYLPLGSDPTVSNNYRKWNGTATPLYTTLEGSTSVLVQNLLNDFTMVTNASVVGPYPKALPTISCEGSYHYIKVKE